MLKKKNVLRFILGLKIRQLRARRDLSLKELAEAADLSVSYLNEIENGKKYPKIEKLAALAQGLSVELSDLVSFKTGRNLHPLLKFLESDMVSKVPLELFGLSESDVVDLMGQDPEKFASFVLTVLQISRAFDMKLEDVYTAALRSYIEANENYFPELEKLARKWRGELNPHHETLTHQDLLNFMQKKFQLHLDLESLTTNPLLRDEKFYLKRSDPAVVFLNRELSTAEKSYYLAKSLGHFLLDENNSTPPESLGAKLLEFKTSYFAGALLLEEKSFYKDLKVFFNSPLFSAEFFHSLIEKSNVSPEVFFQRLTQVLPSSFKVNELFFLKLSSKKDEAEAYGIVQELHLAQLHSPHGVRMNENYCRRWVAIKSIKQLKEKAESSKCAVVAQISIVEDGQEYFSLSFAKEESTKKNTLESLTIGFLVNQELKNVIKFLDDKNLKRISINQTCERCPKRDCEDRAVPSTIYDLELKKELKEKALVDLTL